MVVVCGRVQETVIALIANAHIVKSRQTGLELSIVLIRNNLPNQYNSAVKKYRTIFKF